MRSVFMGTPEAAVPALRRLVDDGHEVVAVWTQPDKPAGRGKKVSAPPVKVLAQLIGLKIYQPAKIRTDDAQSLFASHNADLVVVVAYGRILPGEFLRAPKRGCINIHFSLLPLYRGAAPVNWSIINGETRTGVTTMFIEEKLDAGPITLKQAVDYALQVARGLSAAHGKGIVHRDLKPENLFVSRDGHLKILDFGLAKRVETVAEMSAPTRSGHTEPGTIMGTAGSMSPEPVKGLPVAHRSDIFSFGTIRSERLSGRRAFHWGRRMRR